MIGNPPTGRLITGKRTIHEYGRESRRPPVPITIRIIEDHLTRDPGTVLYEGKNVYIPEVVEDFRNGQWRYVTVAVVLADGRTAYRTGARYGQVRRGEEPITFSRLCWHSADDPFACGKTVIDLLMAELDGELVHTGTPAGEPIPSMLEEGLENRLTTPDSPERIFS